MFQHALLNELVAFIAVAEQGSFTLAAQSLGSSKSSTGKAIRKLEAELGVKLFNRSTRSVRLTEEGAIYLEAAKQAVDTINEAKILLDARRAEPEGRLRVNLPSGIGRRLILRLSEFTRSYPKVRIELSESDRFEEAIEGEWDVVIRIGELEDSSLLAKKLGVLRRVLCGSPDYLARKGTPKNFNDLKDHDGVMYRQPGSKIRSWVFKDKRNKQMEVSPAAIVVCSEGRALVDAALSGAGLAQIYDKALDPGMNNGQLVEVLADKALPGPPVNAIVPSGRRMPAKTRVFLEFLTEVYSEDWVTQPA